jgi:hypothetical protein
LHSYVIQSFISPTNAQLICFKILKFTLKYTINAVTCKVPDDGLVKPRHVEAFLVYFNVNFNILKQTCCALVGLIKDWIPYSRIYHRQYKTPAPLINTNAVSVVIFAL